MFDDEKFELDELGDDFDQDIDDDFGDLGDLSADDVGDDIDLGDGELSTEISDSFEVPSNEFKKYNAQPTFAPKLFGTPLLKKR